MPPAAATVLYMYSIFGITSAPFNSFESQLPLTSLPISQRSAVFPMPDIMLLVSDWTVLWLSPAMYELSTSSTIQ